MADKNQIVCQLFQSKDFNECIAKMKPEHLQEDLKSEVTLALLELPDNYFKDIRNVKHYAVRIILNMMTNKRHPFYKKFRMPNIPYTEPAVYCSPVFVDEVEPEAFESRLKKELNEEKAKEYIESLYWYDKEMVQLYLKLGNYRAIEKETGIPWESSYSTIQKVIKNIRNEFKQN